MTVRLGLLVEDSRVHGVAVARRRVVWYAWSDYRGPEDLGRVLSSLAGERPARVRKAAVALSADVARLKALKGLPALSDADLAAHVRLHSRRYFLQNGIPLVTDARGRGRAGQRESLLAAAPAPLIDAIMDGLGAAGLRCHFIAPASLLDDTPPVVIPDDAAHATAIRTACAAALAPNSLSLVPEGHRHRADRAERGALMRLGIVTVAAGVLAGAAWVASWRREERRATAELARLRPAVESALSARADLRATTEALDLLVAADRANAHRARFLASLARALPDSSFLVQLRLETDGTGSMSGYATRSGAFLGQLQRTGIAGDAVTEGPVTREVVGGREWDRFTVRLRPARTEDGRP